MEQKKSFEFPDYSNELSSRLLSSIDRDFTSKTYGCADRRYWAWKLTDFPDATMSRIVLLLHKLNPESYSQEIEALFDYLFKIQHRDGSFDQAFPYEHSHGATAFLLADLTRVCLGTPDLFHRYKTMLTRAGNYLLKQNEEHGLISNHLAGAALGLMRLSQLSGNQTFERKASDYVSAILEHQSSEGWYIEYDGADPSYQTLCMYYLAQIHQITKDPKLFESLKKAVDFVSYFAHPDGSFGGEYGSRNCEIYYPGGLALLGFEIPLAGRLTLWATQSYRNKTTVTPLSVDNENLTPLYSNVLLAHECSRANQYQGTEKLPYERELFKQSFPEAGIEVINHENYYTIINWKKGGVVKCFDKSKQANVLDDCGPLLKMSNSSWATTQHKSDLHKMESTGSQTTITSPFFKIDQPLPSPSKFLVLRLLNLTLWRFRLFREIGKKTLVKLLISDKKALPYTVKRKIAFTAGLPEIKDILLIDDTDLKLINGKKYSAIHMASSKYYFESGATQETHEVDRITRS